MAKLALPFLVAFIIAAGGVTSIVVVRSRAAAAETVHADSTKSDSAHTAGKSAKDSSAGTPEHPASTPATEETHTASTATGAAAAPAKSAEAKDVEAKGAAPKAVASHAAAPAAAPTTAEPKAPVTIAPRKATDLVEPVVAGGRLSKIFGAMPPKEAARVLGQMEEADAIAIIGSLGDKRAGEVIALLPPERATAVSRALLVAHKGTK